MYLNGLDQVYFDRPINRLVEDKATATFTEAMDVCLQFSLDKGPSVSPSSTSFSSKAYVSTSSVTLPVDRRRIRSSLGVFPVGSKFCPHCWSKGFKNEHAMLTCPHYLRSVARSQSTYYSAHISHGPAVVSPS